MADCRNIQVSVVIPAHNAAATLGEAMRSVLDQSLKAIEVLVCDDASLDGTADIVRSFHDSRVRLYQNQTNQGAGRSRDFLIEQAQGEWVAFMDADDAMLPHRLATLLDIAKKYPDTLIFDDIDECHDTPEGMKPFRRVYGSAAFASGLAAAGIREVSRMALFSSQRTLLKPLVPRSFLRSTGVKHGAFSYGEDCAFFWSLAARGARWLYVPEAMYQYRITPGSASANPARSLVFAQAMESVLNEPLSLDERSIISSRARYLRDLAEFKQAKALPFMRRCGAQLRFFIRNFRRIPFFIEDFLMKLRYALSRLNAGGRRR